MGANISLSDLTDSLGINIISVGDPPGRSLTLTGGSESVMLQWSFFPGTATITGSSGSGGSFQVTVGGTGTINITGFGRWTEPGSTLVSDQFDLFINLSTDINQSSLTVTFLSDTDGTPLGTCTVCPTETGQVQSGLTINWLNAAGGTIATDTYTFQSDITGDVPEPSSAVLLLSGVGLVFLWQRLTCAEPE